jgi:hypothetical protein
MNFFEIYLKGRGQFSRTVIGGTIYLEFTWNLMGFSSAKIGGTDFKGVDSETSSNAFSWCRIASFHGGGAGLCRLQ